VLTCEIETYPHADIKWFIDKNDLAKLHTNKDNPLRSISVHKSVDLNNTTRTYALKSTVVLYYAKEQIYRENFTCRSFFRDNVNFAHSVLFEFQSKTVADYDFLNTRIHGLHREKEGSMRNIPFIYWIILAICILFSVTVILFAVVCIVRSNRNYKRRKREAKRMLGSEYYYDSVNKRSAIYMRSNYSDGTQQQPLKPIVIRDHQDYSSIYSDVNANNSNSNQHNSSLSTTLTSSTPNDVSRYSRLSVSNNRRQPQHRGPATDNSFDHDPVDQSFLPRVGTTSRRVHDEDEATSTTSSGASSSKLFEENFDEYKDPKFDDLRKPVGRYNYKKQPPSSSL
jgi:hypothetical protein